MFIRVRQQRDKKIYFLQMLDSNGNLRKNRKWERKIDRRMPDPNRESREFLISISSRHIRKSHETGPDPDFVAKFSFRELQKN